MSVARFGPFCEELRPLDGSKLRRAVRELLNDFAIKGCHIILQPSPWVSHEMQEEEAERFVATILAKARPRIADLVQKESQRRWGPLVTIRFTEH